MWRKLIINEYNSEEFPRTLGPRAQFRYLTVEQREEYKSDDFRMYTFKIKRCAINRSHDWTMCPFAHKGEKARRRDPKKINYVAITCPQFRLGFCHKAEQCEFAHGVFEYWLHPARYRTRICTGGASCCRKVCFFAHSMSELRPETRYRCTFYPVQSRPQPQTRVVAANSTAFYSGLLSNYPGSGTVVYGTQSDGFNASYYPIHGYHGNTGISTTYYGGNHGSGGSTSQGTSDATNPGRGGGNGGSERGLSFVLGTNGVVEEDGGHKENGYSGGTYMYYEEKPVELKLEFLESLRRLTSMQGKHHRHDDHDHGDGELYEEEKDWGGVDQWDVPDLGWISNMLNGM